VQHVDVRLGDRPRAASDELLVHGHFGLVLGLRREEEFKSIVWSVIENIIQTI
jgi:hypothetical protein